MNDSKDDIEICDLGDAVEETKACSPLPLYVDNIFGYGSESGTSCPPYG